MVNEEISYASQNCWVDVVKNQMFQHNPGSSSVEDKHDWWDLNNGER